MQEIKLLYCPFCRAGTETLKENKTPGGEVLSVELIHWCSDLDIFTAGRRISTTALNKERVINSYNARASDPRTEALVKALEFYANIRNYYDGAPYITAEGDCGEPEEGKIFSGKISFKNKDNGKIAQQALEKWRK